MGLRLNWLALGVAVLISGCTDPATQLLVLVDTDYAVPGELGIVRARILDVDEQERSAAEFVLDSVADGARFAVPFSFAVVPVDDDAQRVVVIEVEGLDPFGRSLVTRRARTGFIEGRSLLLPMFLLEACESVVCPPGQTCGAGGCESEVVDTGRLTSVQPGEELLLGLDAGPNDETDAGLDGGEVDGGVDAGGADAGMDAGMDAGVDGGGSDGGAGDAGDAASMDGGADAGPCAVDYCCPAAPCAPFTCRGTCAAECGPSTVCDITCRSGTNCTATAGPSSTASLACGAGARCDLSCDRAAICEMSCRSSSNCLIHCGGSTVCRFTMCGSEVTCPGGELACNGATCP